MKYRRLEGIRPNGIANNKKIGITDLTIIALSPRFDPALFVDKQGWLVHNVSCPITAALTQGQKDALRRQATNTWETVTGIRASTFGMDIQHRIPLEWSHLFPNAEPNRVANLVGMLQSDHRLVNREWVAFKLH